MCPPTKPHGRRTAPQPPPLPSSTNHTPKFGPRRRCMLPTRSSSECSLQKNAKHLPASEPSSSSSATAIHAPPQKSDTITLAPSTFFLPASTRRRRPRRPRHPRRPGHRPYSATQPHHPRFPSTTATILTHHHTHPRPSPHKHITLSQTSPPLVLNCTTFPLPLLLTRSTSTTPLIAIPPSPPHSHAHTPPHTSLTSNMPTTIHFTTADTHNTNPSAYANPQHPMLRAHTCPPFDDPSCSLLSQLPRRSSDSATNTPLQYATPPTTTHLLLSTPPAHRHLCCASRPPTIPLLLPRPTSSAPPPHNSLVRTP
uniref:Uncharacterized protein n=1 Tax=Physcomitrium patens TaxID=3218 RepID=A0A2K1J199_PHYPA|nr:hypothetical protein PHYPA_023195 [Physcomitrium patens]